LAVKYEEFRLGLAVGRLRTAEEDWSERGVVRIATQEEKRADEVPTDDRSDEIGDFFSSPDEVALKIREADSAVKALLDEPDYLPFVGDDLHGGGMLKGSGVFGWCVPNLDRSGASREGSGL